MLGIDNVALPLVSLFFSMFILYSGHTVAETDVLRIFSAKCTLNILFCLIMVFLLKYPDAPGLLDVFLATSNAMSFWHCAFTALLLYAIYVPTTSVNTIKWVSTVAIFGYFLFILIGFFIAFLGFSKYRKARVAPETIFDATFKLVLLTVQWVLWLTFCRVKGSVFAEEKDLVKQIKYYFFWFSGYFFVFHVVYLVFVFLELEDETQSTVGSYGTIDFLVWVALRGRTPIIRFIGGLFAILPINMFNSSRRLYKSQEMYREMTKSLATRDMDALKSLVDSSPQELLNATFMCCIQCQNLELVTYFLMHEEKSPLMEYEDDRLRTFPDVAKHSGNTVLLRYLMGSLHFEKPQILEYKDLTNIKPFNEGNFGILFRAKLIFRTRQNDFSVDVVCKISKGVADNLSDVQMFRFCLDITKGVAHLHKNGYTHRDIGLRNSLLHLDENKRKEGSRHDILFKKLQRVVICDFGLSRQNNYKFSSDDDVMIPWRSTPPETLSALGFSPKSDVWMIGITLWEMLKYGMMPFGDIAETFDSLTAVLAQHKNRQVPLFFDRRASNDIRTIINKCCRFEPQQRILTSDLQIELTRLIDALSVGDDQISVTIRRKSKYRFGFPLMAHWRRKPKSHMSSTEMSVDTDGSRSATRVKSEDPRYMSLNPNHEEKELDKNLTGYKQTAPGAAQMKVDTNEQKFDNSDLKTPLLSGDSGLGGSIADSDFDDEAKNNLGSDSPAPPDAPGTPGAPDSAGAPGASGAPADASRSVSIPSKCYRISAPGGVKYDSEQYIYLKMKRNGKSSRK